jgi:hypothetical protein
MNAAASCNAGLILFDEKTQSQVGSDLPSCKYVFHQGDGSLIKLSALQRHFGYTEEMEKVSSIFTLYLHLIAKNITL